MRVDKNQQLQADTQGDYSFRTDFSGDSYLNFLLGFADCYQQLQNLNTEPLASTTPIPSTEWTTGMCCRASL